MPAASALLLLAVAAFAAPSPPPDGFVLSGELLRQPLERQLEDVERARALGAGHVTVPALLCQKDRRASEIRWCPDADRARLSALLDELRTRGFTFTLFPFLRVEDGAWRGEIEPADFSRWSADYQARVDEVTALAREHGAAELLVASEMSSLYLKQERFWRELLGRYKGKGLPVFLVANWDQYDKLPFWKDSDYIGLSGYYPLTDSREAAASSGTLTARWAEWAAKLRAASRREGRPLYFNEVGYLSREGAAFEPWGPKPPVVLDLDVQARLFRAFADTWSDDKSVVRVLLWALSVSSEPATDSGYSPVGKPAAQEVAALFSRRAAAKGLPPPRPLDALLTLDDLPMWFVSDVNERLDQYARLKEIAARHGAPLVAFVNAAGLKDEREWAALAGYRLANHTATHLPRSTTTLAGFLADVDADTAALDERAPGWDAAGRYFRFPNLDWGPRPAETCRALRRRGFTILPVSLDSKDWSYAPRYQPASGVDLEKRADQAAARAVARELLDGVDAQFDAAARSGVSTAIVMVHSTRLTRDYLDTELTRLERRGVRWVAPSAAALKDYRPGPDCVPACVAARRCF